MSIRSIVLLIGKRCRFQPSCFLYCTADLCGRASARPLFPGSTIQTRCNSSTILSSSVCPRTTTTVRDSRIRLLIFASLWRHFRLLQHIPLPLLPPLRDSISPPNIMIDAATLPWRIVPPVQQYTPSDGFYVVLLLTRTDQRVRYSQLYRLRYFHLLQVPPPGASSACPTNGSLLVHKHLCVSRVRFKLPRKGGCSRRILKSW